jgi:hypothetical protein
MNTTITSVSTKITSKASFLKRIRFVLFLGSFFLLVGSGTALAQESTPEEPNVANTGPSSLLMRDVTWDVHLAAGGGLPVGGDLHGNNFLARGRVGVLLVYEPFFVGIGPTLEIGGLAQRKGAYGAQLDVVHIWSGVTAQLGVSRIPEFESYMSNISLGFSLLSVEWQHGFFPEDTTDSELDWPSRDALFLKLRIPIGILAYALSQ